MTPSLNLKARNPLWMASNSFEPTQSTYILRLEVVFGGIHCKNAE